MREESDARRTPEQVEEDRARQRAYRAGRREKDARSHYLRRRGDALIAAIPEEPGVYAMYGSELGARGGLPGSATWACWAIRCGQKPPTGRTAIASVVVDHGVVTLSPMPSTRGEAREIVEWTIRKIERLRRQREREALLSLAKRKRGS